MTMNGEIYVMMYTKNVLLERILYVKGVKISFRISEIGKQPLSQ